MNSLPMTWKIFLFIWQFSMALYSSNACRMPVATGVRPPLHWLLSLSFIPQPEFCTRCAISSSCSLFVPYFLFWGHLPLHAPRFYWRIRRSRFRPTTPFRRSMTCSLFRIQNWSIADRILLWFWLRIVLIRCWVAASCMLNLNNIHTCCRHFCDDVVLLTQ